MSAPRQKQKQLKAKVVKPQIRSRPPQSARTLGAVVSQKSKQPKQRSIASPSQKSMIVPPRQKPHKPKQKREKEWWETAIESAVPLIAKYGPAILSGFGDYELDSIQSNSVLAATSNGSYGTVPMIENSKTYNCVHHREYIGDVNGSTLSFNPVTYPINPGLDVTFPWLSAQAACYTGYRLKGIIFEFITDASEFSSTPYLGYVAMGTQYDSVDTPFPSKREMLNSDAANSGKPSENLLHPVECAKSENVLSQLYVRLSSGSSATADKRFYDLGQFTIATGGQASNGKIGELWATYDVEFFKPKLAHSLGQTVNTDVFELTGVTNAAPLGTTTSSGLYPNNTLGGTIDAAGLKYSFPTGVTSGLFQCSVYWHGTAGAVISYPGITLSGCTAVTAPWTITPTINSPANGVTTTNMWECFYVNITAEKATMTFSAATLPASYTDGYFLITQIPNTLSGPSLADRDDPVINSAQFIESLSDAECRLLFQKYLNSNPTDRSRNSSDDPSITMKSRY